MVYHLDIIQIGISQDRVCGSTVLEIATDSVILWKATIIYLLIKCSAVKNTGLTVHFRTSSH